MDIRRDTVSPAPDASIVPPGSDSPSEIAAPPQAIAQTDSQPDLESHLSALLHALSPPDPQTAAAEAESRRDPPSPDALSYGPQSFPVRSRRRNPDSSHGWKSSGHPHPSPAHATPGFAPARKAHT